MSEQIDLERLIDDQEQADEREKLILARLLQKAADKKGYVLSHHSGMGKTLTEIGSSKIVPSYAATHTLDWISKNIRLGSQMPFMENKIDKATGRLIIDEENAEEVKQRAPDWTRQPALAAYLAQPQRKFGPIIAVLSPAWVDQPQHENWGVDGRAIQGAAEFLSLDMEGRIGLLKVGDINIYALDGQHRVIGIRGIREVSENPAGLVMKTKDGAPKSGTNSTMSRTQFLDRFRMPIEELQSILSETMLVEYIPAVIKGETREEASRRIRNTFISINSYAKSTAKGENILLDETDGYAIVARRAGLAHPLFNASSKNNRVNWKNTSIPKSRTTWYTTLQTIREMAEIYLQGANIDRAKLWSPEFRDQMPIRPTEKELEEAKADYFAFLDQFYQLPVFAELERLNEEIDKKIDDPSTDEKEKKKLDASRAEIVTAWREFPTEDNPDYKGHLLLRPVGQMIVADAVSTLVAPKGKKRHDSSNHGRGLTLDEIFEKLRAFDAHGGFAAHDPKNVWYGITYDGRKQKMLTTTRSRDIAHDLLVYLIDGMPDEQIPLLWNDFVQERITDPAENKWRNLQGEISTFDLSKPELPPRI